ncbi:hypothetical protein E2C01_043772 [Portunus trituberculatus]|uniref:Uncharacterized protein n=1 Tax=Portunus trituberculatus TaxID=210409 RepID=A0A5B7FX03_PORTR|nr:hypothetical protein [Portunus trituberculatus]
MFMWDDIHGSWSISVASQDIKTLLRSNIFRKAFRGTQIRPLQNQRPFITITLTTMSKNITHRQQQGKKPIVITSIIIIIRIITFTSTTLTIQERTSISVSITTPPPSSPHL